jgi:hypothetical protein
VKSKKKEQNIMTYFRKKIILEKFNFSGLFFSGFMFFTEGKYFGKKTQVE